MQLSGIQTSFAACALALVVLAPRPGAGAAAAARTPTLAGAHEMAFEPNRGQTDPSVRFLARRPGWLALLRDRDVVIRLDDTGASDIRIRFRGAEVGVEVRGEGELHGRAHYFIGDDPQRWLRNVPRYARVRYAGILPGIDAVFRGSPDELEFDLVVAPGADPASVALDFEGAEDVRLVDGNDLLLRHAGGRELRLRAPLVYQEADGERRTIQSRYVLAPDGGVTFALATYDPELPLVIDPILAYSTFLGGSASDLAHAIAVGADGSVYLAGQTRSVDFPLQGPFSSQTGPDYVAFVTRLDPTGSSILYSTFLGGTGDLAEFDQMAIAVDAQGSAHLTGETNATDFPTVNAFMPTARGGFDAFVTRLTPNGSNLVFSTYYGGSNDDFGRGIAVDPNGFVSVIGLTLSTDLFTGNAIQTSRAGPTDAFVLKLKPVGALVYATYLGGSGTEFGYDIGVDADGNAYVTGLTNSTDFPTTAGVVAESKPGGVNDAFLAKLDPPGDALVWATYLGGSGEEEGLGVDVDRERRVYVSGWTTSTDFPTTAQAAQPTHGGDVDIYVARLAADAATLDYATFLGGTNAEWSYDLSVDQLGRATVAGSTASPDFPTVSAVQTSLGGPVDGCVARLSADGSAFEYATYLGGTQVENPMGVGFGVDVDRRGNVYLAASSNSSDFPTVLPLQPGRAGLLDATVAKIASQPEVNLKLRADAAGTAMTLQILNGEATPQQVEIKLWVDRPGPNGQLGLLAIPLTLPSLFGPIELNVTLPAAVLSPGTILGARLIDIASGSTLSESLCPSVPCH